MRRSLLVAFALSAALASWFASRPLSELLGLERRDVSPPDALVEPSRARPLTPVRVTESLARPTAPELLLSGVTEPARTVILRAELSGRVLETPVAQGARVEAGAPIVRLDPRERPERVRELEARLAQRELEFEAASRLGARGFQAETRVAEARAALEEARARLKEARAELERSVVRAPFAGRLERRLVEVGDFVEVGREVAVLVEPRPFLIVARAPESRVHELAAGLSGSARLADGRVLEGRLRFVARRAEDATRTFRVELEIPDPPEDLAAGVTARLAIRLPEVPAHRLPASALVLDDAGRIGVRLVDEEDRVRFAPVVVLRAEGGMLWLSGLPERARVITTGQGFVGEGERVLVRPEPPARTDGSAA
ncbi:MAG: efflux RND transporter periplasmic adaptor subunit [Geminicoccaceae bacterium]|nr:efflux RND transporter periplasmic adaptor subunit [Geminicoccaceae bacterium]MDW8341545.1 efflux RND transporter periplasmic adaptor subunit [Geminicoccaceae bacterium]